MTNKIIQKRKLKGKGLRYDIVDGTSILDGLLS
jgi:hypothetical protein